MQPDKYLYNKYFDPSSNKTNNALSCNNSTADVTFKHILIQHSSVSWV